MQRTDRAQILIGTFNITLFELLKTEGICPDIILGHSAGELSSLYASGVIGIEDALRLISYRGKFMYEAAQKHKGKMVSIINADYNKVEQVVEKYKNYGIISIGNYNSPDQIVLTGDYDLVTLFEQEISKKPSVRVVDLKQQGAWHSEHMLEAQHRFAQEIGKVDLKKPSIPIMLNYSAEFIDDVINIRSQIVNIITSTVNWYPCLRKLAQRSGLCFAEIGPNKILRGLLRRCYKSLEMNSYKVVNVNNVATLEHFLQKIYLSIEKV